MEKCTIKQKVKLLTKSYSAKRQSHPVGTVLVHSANNVYQTFNPLFHAASGMPKVDG